MVLVRVLLIVDVSEIVEDEDDVEFDGVTFGVL